MKCKSSRAGTPSSAFVAAAKPLTESTAPSKSSRAKKVVLASSLVAAILAGGGTFALWQESAPVSAGQVSIGSMDLGASTGTWTSSRSGVVNDINSYRASSGETLTFTQELDVSVEGDNVAAQLEATGLDPTTLQEGFTVGRTSLIDSMGEELSEPHIITQSGTFTASTTVTIGGTPEAPGYGNVAALDEVGYALTQATQQVESVAVHEYTLSNGQELGAALRAYSRDLHNIAWAKFIEPIDVEAIEQALVADLASTPTGSRMVIDSVEFEEGATSTYAQFVDGYLNMHNSYGGTVLANFGSLFVDMNSGATFVNPDALDSSGSAAYLKDEAAEALKDWRAPVSRLARENRQYTYNPLGTGLVSGTIDGKEFLLEVNIGSDSQYEPAYVWVSQSGQVFTNDEMAEFGDLGNYQKTLGVLSSTPTINDATFREITPEPSAELEALLKSANEELLREVVGTW